MWKINCGEPRNLPISAEFILFCTILWNSVLVGDKGTNMACFGWLQAAVENYLPRVENYPRWATEFPHELARGVWKKNLPRKTVILKYELHGALLTNIWLVSAVTDMHNITSYLVVSVAQSVVAHVGSWAEFEKPRFFGKSFLCFKVFIDFGVPRELDTKFRPRKNILYTILSVTLFSINYNKTHKSWLKYIYVCIKFHTKFFLKTYKKLDFLKIITKLNNKD